MYNFILITHILTALLLIATVVYADHLAFDWMRGKKSTLPKGKMGYIHYTIYVGLTIMLLTGLYMFLPLRDFLLSQTAFQIKMGLLAALILNSFAISYLMNIATESSFMELDTKTKGILLASGGISTICWVGIVIAASQLGV